MGGGLALFCGRLGAHKGHKCLIGTTGLGGGGGGGGGGRVNLARIYV